MEQKHQLDKVECIEHQLDTVLTELDVVRDQLDTLVGKQGVNKTTPPVQTLHPRADVYETNKRLLCTMTQAQVSCGCGL